MKNDTLPIKLAIGKHNRYNIATKTLTISEEDIDSFTVDHELGHGVMDFIVSDSKHINQVKIPHFRHAVKYAWKTYVTPEDVERADEGWAQSFCDYFNRKNYLKSNSPELFKFWNSFMRKNPRVLNTRKHIHSEMKSKKQKGKIMRMIH